MFVIYQNAQSIRIAGSSPAMKVILVVLFILASMASWAWYGAQEPHYTRGQKRTYGLIAIACWIALAVLANTFL
jgi:hypothetical protein